MIELEMIGGAGTVTGSKYVLRTNRATVLLDCGLFQGPRKESFEKNRALPVNPAALDAVVLSHAHLDHSGALPVLWQRGYRGPIYATPATRALCVPMLEDSAAIQLSDSRHIDKLIARGVDLQPVSPLYTADDAVGAIELMIGLPYHRTQVIAPGVTLTFLDAGHVLGSAIVVLDLDDEGAHTRLAFTGDLGRSGLPILRDPEVVTGAHCLITESTYGDRLHPELGDTIETFAATIRRTIARGGKVIIPAFALERAQELIYTLQQLRTAKRVPSVPVYVDSPLAIKVTDVFRLHPECMRREVFSQLRGSGSPFDFPGLTYVTDVEASKELDLSSEPSIIIAGSGMCEGGRVLHHLRATIEDARTTVLIVGFQAEHTLGRRLVEQRRDVKIFGVLRPRHADVVSLGGLSAHADQRGLVEYAEAARARGPLRRVILVHGEDAARAGLASRLAAAQFPLVDIPLAGARIRL
ncbi:MAG: MBL fold metallo-hydrolase [Myxococcales bacterium]|nr:MBL fold metallo-hydrolase [Myxococcales bacterium]